MILTQGLHVYNEVMKFLPHPHAWKVVMQGEASSHTLATQSNVVTGFLFLNCAKEGVHCDVPAANRKCCV
jgi:hypothetical protein